MAALIVFINSSTYLFTVGELDGFDLLGAVLVVVEVVPLRQGLQQLHRRLTTNLIF